MTSPLPLTLFAHAGVTPQPLTFGEAAILVIDAQNEYLDGALPLAGIGAALDAVADLLERARSAAAPVIHIRHRGSVGGLFDITRHNGSLCERAAALPAETIIDKPRPNAFSGTDLAGVFRATGRKGLIMAGFMTHMCVSSTARAALDLGIPVTLVTGATATRDLPDGQGGVVTAAELQRAELAALGDRFVVQVARAAELAASSR